MATGVPFFPSRAEGWIYTPSKLSNNSSGMNDISWYTRISSIYASQYIKATPMRQSLLNWTSCLVIHMVNIYINKAIKPLPSSSFAPRIIGWWVWFKEQPWHPDFEMCRCSSFISAQQGLLAIGHLWLFPRSSIWWTRSNVASQICSLFQ